MLAARVAVQSSQRLLRNALAACLAIRPDVTVAGRVAEAADVLVICELSSPDVVILDAGRRLGEMAGRVRNLVRRFPELNVIVIYRITRPTLKPLPGLSSDMARHLAAGSCAISDEKPDRRTRLA